jgi:hypothetical protein
MLILPVLSLQADVETDSAPVVDPACLDWVKAKLQLVCR